MRRVIGRLSDEVQSCSVPCGTDLEDVAVSRKSLPLKQGLFSAVRGNVCEADKRGGRRQGGWHDVSRDGGDLVRAVTDG